MTVLVMFKDKWAVDCESGNRRDTSVQKMKEGILRRKGAPD